MNFIISINLLFVAYKNERRKKIKNVLSCFLYHPYINTTKETKCNFTILAKITEITLTK